MTCPAAIKQLRCRHPLSPAHLGYARTRSLPLKRPPVVAALQAPLLVYPALRKRRQAVGALVQEAAPLALAPVIPEDDRLAED